MAAWFEPLLTLLAEQPPDTPTLTLTLVEIEALAQGPLPAGAAARGYWQRHVADGLGRQMAAIGWRVRRFHRYPTAVTFVRVPAADA